MKRSIVALVGMIVVGTTQGAGVYRCTSAAGEVIYSDAVCMDRPDRAAVAIDPPSSDLRGYPISDMRNIVVGIDANQPGAALMVSEGTWMVHGDNWQVASQYSKVHCIKLHPGDYSLQAACMRNAARGFDELRGNYDMPPQIAQQAKIHCIRMHPEDFSIQAACMRNQSRGYRDMR
ncbi:DUF4124 domain-containing protein [Thiocystis violascens]|uniref:DUF4124 domain-containing protein n=1 Tax=Thiocystis violascens (strain ATCC 17096 / DSM 198 / 6111) TaxID=765911 RepID=I3YGU4_THIV6|nr:DUF4124 domain-containing protein [Thiocystis violascens]AFL76212.1 hypothetical protein Thivi_4409 [Thiocystis violascens DSM 198]